MKYSRRAPYWTSLLLTLIFFVSCVSTPEDGEDGGPSWLVALWEGEHFPDLGEFDSSNLENRELVAKRHERGKYLVQSIAACGICHGAQPANPETALSGGRRIRSEDGYVQAANITPDIKTGIGRWSISEIVDGMRSSQRPDGSRLSRGVHSSYAWISDEDARAIALFLLANEPVNNRVDRNEPGWLSNRDWKVFSSQKENKGYVPEYKVSATAQYGRYLSHNVAGCKSCHSPESPDIEELFSGSTAGTGGFVRSLQKLGSSLVNVTEASKDESTAVTKVVSPKGQREIDEREREKNADPSIVSRIGNDLRESLKPEPVENNFPLGGPDIRGTSSGINILSYLNDGSLPDGRKVDPKLCPLMYYRNMNPVDKQAITYYLKRL